MEFLNEVSQRIKFFRKEKGLTQEALAQKADIDISFLGKIERGTNNNISLETLNKILFALDIEYGEFFSFSDITRNVEKSDNMELSKDIKTLLNNIMLANNREEVLELLLHVTRVSAKYKS